MIECVFKTTINCSLTFEIDPDLVKGFKAFFLTWIHIKINLSI